MKMSKEKFKSLQKYWYDILKASGFEDIEKLVGGELVLKQSANYQLRDLDPLEKEARQEYFAIITHKTNDEKTLFRNNVDRIIMQEHANGAQMKEIIVALTLRGESRCRRAIRVIIRKYEMEWGIRKYTDQQLNIYKKKV